MINTTDKIFYKAATLLLALILAVYAGWLQASPDDTDQQRLQDGEVLLEIINQDKAGGSARVTAIFNTTADRVWSVIGYCKYEFVYIRGLKACEVLKPGQQKMVVRHRVRNSWYTPTLEFSFAASRGADGRGQARLLDGDLQIFAADWQMQPLDGGNQILVTHEIHVKPVTPAPRWLVRRSLRKDLADMLACIRGLAESTATNGAVSADLDRCPGELPDGYK